MKNRRKIVPIILFVMLGISWLACLNSGIGQYRTYRNHAELAQKSVEMGLYEQAIEEYKEMLSYRKTDDTWENIKKAYELLYAENEDPYIRNCYVSDMAQAAEDYPHKAEYWKIQLNLYMEEKNYSKAYEVTKKAVKVPVKDEEIQTAYKKLLYMVKTDYQLYTDYRTCLNGYISVCDGNKWKVLDEQGKVLTGSYDLIGLINDDGKGIYMDQTAAWLMDRKEIARERFSLEITDAGYYSESLELVPVQTGGIWKYLKVDGSFLPGEYEMAGSFYDGRAAVKKDGQWYLIDEKGQQASDRTFEDIKLDLYGCHQQGDIILAKENGAYHIYDKDLKQVGDFSSDDVDICINDGLIAFQKDGKWGYVNTKGEVIVEPSYEGAKSFSNGMAAVQNEDLLWGFINKDYELVIDPVYLDAGYFTSEETCMVSTTENNYQIQRYRFE